MNRFYAFIKKMCAVVSFCFGTFLFSDVMSYTAYGAINPDTGDDSQRRMIMMGIAAALAIVIIIILLLFKRKK